MKDATRAGLFVRHPVGRLGPFRVEPGTTDDLVRLTVAPETDAADILPHD